MSVVSLVLAPWFARVHGIGVDQTGALPDVGVMVVVVRALLGLA
jgi:hypothetical protein